MISVLRGCFTCSLSLRVIRVVRRNRVWNDPRQPRKALAALDRSGARCAPHFVAVLASPGRDRPPLALSVRQGRPVDHPVAWRTERARPGPGSPAFAAPCAASSGELCSPGDASTAANAVSEARGSKDATRLSSLREIGDFPLAARIRRILATSRESFALSNDSEPRSGRAPRGLSRLSQFIPRPIPLNHPCHAHVYHLANSPGSR